MLKDKDLRVKVNNELTFHNQVNALTCTLRSEYSLLNHLFILF